MNSKAPTFFVAVNIYSVINRATGKRVFWAGVRYVGVRTRVLIYTTRVRDNEWEGLQEAFLWADRQNARVWKIRQVPISPGLL